MKIDEVLYSLIREIGEYLPSLMAGLLLVLIGLGGGWLTKRIIVQVCLMLKLGRQFRRFRWGRDLVKADVRLSLYNLLGTTGFLVVFLVFLNAAFSAMKLTVLSALSEKVVFLFPRLAASLLIFAVGWFLAMWISAAILSNLRKEEVPRATLIAGYGRLVVLLFFAAMAIAELDVAREVVLIGFAVLFITLGAVTVILTAAGGKGIVEKLLSSSREE